MVRPGTRRVIASTEKFDGIAIARTAQHARERPCTARQAAGQSAAAEYRFQLQVVVADADLAATAGDDERVGRLQDLRLAETDATSSGVG